MARARPPARSISEATVRAASGLRSTTATLAPSAANRSAEACPMPDPAPVTIATLSLSFMQVLLLGTSSTPSLRFLYISGAAAGGPQELVGRQRQDALGNPRRRVNQAMAHQVLVHPDRRGRVMPERRHAADGVAGRPLDRIRIGAA